MKYVLNKDLPTFKAGIEAWMSEHGNLVTEEDGEKLVIYSALALAKFPSILTEWFTPVEEKRKVVPVVPDKIYTISATGYVGESEYGHSVGELTINQGNWRWTQEEAELEARKRAAIERVRRYLVRNDLLEEDKNEIYKTIYVYKPSKLIECICPIGYSYYSPYGRVKDTDLTQFIKDCREDLLLIHS